jgi:hypothetical protein
MDPGDPEVAISIIDQGARLLAFGRNRNVQALNEGALNQIP